jgi:hypothetical protein
MQLKEVMMKLENNELINIYGGSTISGTLLNSVSRILETIMDVGRSLGTSIRMIYSGKRC